MSVIPMTARRLCQVWLALAFVFGMAAALEIYAERTPYVWGEETNRIAGADEPPWGTSLSARGDWLTVTASTANTIGW